MSQPGSKISVGLSHRELPNKAYISTRAFNSGAGALYSYSTSLNGNYQTVGSLVLNTGLTAANSPAGRVVHANGKVLIPGVNPGGGVGVSPVTGGGSSTPSPLPFPMIGVYDPVTGLNGYINPTDSTWAEYSASLAAFYDNAANPDAVLGGQGAEPRYGRAFAGAATTTTPTFATGTARVGLLTCTTASVTEITVTNSEVNSNSVILLTLQNASIAAGTGAPSLRVQSINSGNFVIRCAALAAGDVIHFLIIN